MKARLEIDVTDPFVTHADVFYTDDPVAAPSTLFDQVAIEPGLNVIEITKAAHGNRRWALRFRNHNRVPNRLGVLGNVEEVTDLTPVFDTVPIINLNTGLGEVAFDLKRFLTNEGNVGVTWSDNGDLPTWINRSGSTLHIDTGAARPLLSRYVYATDVDGDVAEALIKVKIVADLRPVRTGFPPRQEYAQDSGPHTVDMRLYFSGGDGTLKYEIVQAPEGVTIHEDSGEVTIPASATANASLGEYVQVRAYDLDGDDAFSSINYSVIGDNPPDILGIGRIGVKQGETYVFDPSAYVRGGEAPYTFQLIGEPSWITGLGSSTNKTYQIAPPIDAAIDVYNMTLRVTDEGGAGESADRDMQVEVYLERRPEWVGMPSVFDRYVGENGELGLKGFYIGADKPLTVRLNNPPGWAEIDYPTTPDNPVLVINTGAPRSGVLELIVRDANGDEDPHQITVTVLPDPTPGPATGLRIIET